MGPSPTSEILNKCRRALRNRTGTTFTADEIKHLTKLGILHRLFEAEADDLLALVEERQPPSDSAVGEVRPKVFTVKSLAAHWECSDGLIRNMIARGELRSFRYGNMIRITREAVAEVEARRG